MVISNPPHRRAPGHDAAAGGHLQLRRGAVGIVHENNAGAGAARRPGRQRKVPCSGGGPVPRLHGDRRRRQADRGGDVSAPLRRRVRLQKRTHTMEQGVGVPSPAKTSWLSGIDSLTQTSQTQGLGDPRSELRLRPQMRYHMDDSFEKGGASAHIAVSSILACN